ncbi:MAG: tetratricopeptide repeat protein [Pyrinomonadaceae bacterium]|jgi:type VI secretion system protein ImpE|nr:tetratricopeptide repeat protein [Pyrinomonadaceae bacterium]
MTNEAKAQLDAGDLGGAIQTALNVVKANPTNISARIFLFELSLFSGDWERAERQLDTIGLQDANAMIGSLTYRLCIEAERKRQKLFSNGLKPEFLQSPPDYIYGLFGAVNRVREGKLAEAREILDKVEEQRPAFACKVNGTDAEDFRDYNDLTSCVLEAFVKDSYVWIPFEEIVQIEFEKPKSLRDLFWLQAKIETSDGSNGEMFIPTLYVNSFKNDNDQIRLGRMTDWLDLGEDLYAGEGMKTFFINGESRGILELEKVEFE